MWLTRRWQRRPDTVRACRKTQLSLEHLEDRTVPSLTTHLLLDPVNGVPFAWANANPSDPAHTTVYYDFRPLHGFQNAITPAEEARAVDAFNLWSAATNGKLLFLRNTTAPDSQIINVGTGDLAAVGQVSGGGIVGEGGVDLAYPNLNGKNVLQQGYAWLDSAQRWDTVVGNGNVFGTVDYFSIVAHEIGHALGLDHSDGLPGPSIMDSVNRGELTGASASDASLIQELYPPSAGSPSKAIGTFAVAADAGGGPQVRFFNGSQQVFSLFAYDPNYTGGVRVAVGDVTGDGVPDLITAAGPGGGPDIHVYDGRNGALIRQFFAYDPNFTGGCYVAAGDVNGDGRADIIIGADAGGGPNVVVFSGADNRQLYNFFAYDMHFTGGVRVGAGDVNGDGAADIVCGAGPGGGPNVTVFSGRDGSRLQSFFAYDPRFTAGIFVTATDLNGDGKADVVTGAGPGGGPNVSVFSGADSSVLASYFAYDPSVASGVRVGTAHGTTGDVIVTIPGPGGSPKVSEYNRALTLLDSFYAFDSQFTGGGFVAGG